MKKTLKSLFTLVLLLSVWGNCSSQTIVSDSLDLNPQLGLFLGTGTERFIIGDGGYDQGGAGGTAYKEHTINKAEGTSYSLGMQFKIPLKQTVSFFLEGTGIVASHKLQFQMRQGGMGDGSVFTADYTTVNSFFKMAGMVEKRYGKNWNYFFALGPYVTFHGRSLSTKGNETIHTFESGTPAAPATIYADKVIYNDEIKTIYKTEPGLSILTGFSAPIKKASRLFVDLRYFQPIRLALANPNIGIRHFSLNAGMLFDLNF